MARINFQLSTRVYNISEKALELLQSYHWPGNVRELENLLERAINLATLKRTTKLDIDHFPSLLAGVSEIPLEEMNQQTLADNIEKMEKDLIERMLKTTNNNKSQAAKLLGINKSVFYRKLRKYDLLD